MGNRKAAIEQAANTVAIQATAKIEAAGRELHHLKAQMGRDATRLVTKAADDLDCNHDAHDAVAQGSRALIEAALREIEANARPGDSGHVAEGLAIAKDAEDRPITSREAAMRSPEFAVQFHDGTVPGSVRGSEGGDGQ